MGESIVEATIVQWIKNVGDNELVAGNPAVFKRKLEKDD